MSSVITLSALNKSFGDTKAIDDVNLEIRENEFFAMLGPSGCGKTTLLRTIAGFESPDSGQVLLHGSDMTPLRPNKRPINLMFQSYALFPHMTVAKNIAYGLEMEDLTKQEIASRVADVMDMAHLNEFANRKPDQLSGGQRQRVALARALVKRPKVLLLDEPLGALDKKLREQMQLELKRLQHEAGITFIMVTHDQEEALVMADRIALMKDGKVAQLGTPQELYEQPNSRFVADFIGSMNFYDGSVEGENVTIKNGSRLKGLITQEDLTQGTLAVRPERISVHREVPEESDNLVKGVIEDIAYHGQDLNIHVAIANEANRTLARIPASLAEKQKLKLGETVWCSWTAQNGRVLGA